LPEAFVDFDLTLLRFEETVMKLIPIVIIFAFAIGSPAHAGLLGPLGGSGLNGEYASASDSPFNGLNFSYFYLEDFEDLLLNTPGVSSNGMPLNPTTSPNIS
jgi:hypothetical protein